MCFQSNAVAGAVNEILTETRCIDDLACGFVDETARCARGDRFFSGVVGEGDDLGDLQ